jgi:hypothetical protein
MKNKTILAVLLITLGITCRFLPHPANFAPIMAIALFSGIYLSKKWAITLPLSAMFISDIFIGFYSPKIMLAVYISFAIMGLIGLAIRKNKKFSTILGGTLLGSIIFFLATNTAVWAFGTMYTHDISGLMQSYAMAMPFFRNSLLGNLFYVGILVGSMELISNYYKTKQIISKQNI